MIVNHWPGWFRELSQSAWDGQYVTFDLETSGYSKDLDVITQVAHCLVRAGKVVNTLCLIIDWTGREVPPDSWLRSRLDALRYNLQKNGHGGGMSYARMKKEGVKPEKALSFYYELFETFKKDGVICVAHNGYGFDELVLEANLSGFAIANGFDFGDNGLLDTDLLERANQLPTHERTRPWEGDTLRTYFDRLRGLRLKGLKSNLSEHCREKYAFAAHGIEAADMHEADVDAFCLHLLMEAFRKELREPLAGLPVPAPPQLAALAPGVPVRRRGQRNR